MSSNRMPRPRWRLGVDTGGTFTDVVATDGEEFRIAKVPSTPPQFDRGVLAAIAAAGVAIPEISILAHGTTVATNAVIMREGSPTALLTTSGFRDVLELRRHNRGELYDILWDPPDPVVKRRYRFEIRERIDYAGNVLQPLNETDVERAVNEALRAGIKAFAVCFLHSYVNTAHEQRAREIVIRRAPEAYVYCSADLLREPGEFERTSTVAINAFLGPIVSGYLDSLGSALAEAGFRGRLFVMHSGGGLLTAETAVRMPARLLTSGPAAGALAAERVFSSGSPAAGTLASEQIARETGADQLISLDIGGTSADIAVIRDGKARLVNEYSVEFGSPIRFPAIDLTSIGAGGGSIASVDTEGLPSVGPRSAGALPGPAAYGHGGTEPCVTDANVVLGRLSVDTPLAGGVSLDVEAARSAVASFARRAGLALDEAALGIIEIANGNMARAIRLVTVERGLDPRDFSLVAFGGAGGLHAAELAEGLQIERVIIPIAPGVTSALGCLHADVVHDVAEAYIAPLAGCDTANLAAVFARLREHALSLLELDRIDVERRTLELSVDLRYEGQRRGLTLRLGEHDLAPGFEERFRERFLEEYERQFRYAARDIAIEIATLRVRAHGVQAGPVGLETGEPRPASTQEPGRPVIRQVVTRTGLADATIYERAALHCLGSIGGPAIVHEYDSTTWVPSGWGCALDNGGHLILTRGASAGGDSPAEAGFARGKA
jgi:N-methylhydantoinase A